MTDITVTSPFQNFFWKEVDKVQVQLTGKYSKKNGKAVARALRFWSVIADFESVYSDYVASGVEVDSEAEVLKEEILRASLNHSNQFIGCVAISELLPTKVWRRCLWFYNIDFMSFESFLRRVTREQVEALKDSLVAVDEKRVPECFNSGWKNVLRRVLVFDWLSFSRIIDSDVENSLRYDPKRSLKYEFFNIDFGFATYRKESCDYGVKGRFSERFWDRSEEKKGDFVVNQEDGFYWFMYRIPRSNYIWFPNKDVQLKKAICPGFWYTLAIWLLVIAISPVAIVLSVWLSSSEINSYLYGFIVACGLVTPAVILAVISKFIFVKVTSSIGFCAEKVKIPINKDYWKKTALSFCVIFVLSCVGFASIWLVSWLYSWLYESVALTIFFAVYLYLYGSYFAQKLDDKEYVVPWKLPIIGVPAVVFASAKVLFDYREPLSELLLLVVAFVVASWGYILAVAFVLSMLVVIAWSSLALEKLEDKFYHGDKAAIEKMKKIESFMSTAIKIQFALSLVLLLYLMVFLPTISWVIVVCLAGLILMSVYVMNNYVYSPRYAISVENTSLAILECDDEWYRQEIECVLKALVNNVWLNSQEDYLDKSKTLISFIRQYFNLNYFPKEILLIDGKGFSLFGEYSDFFDKRTIGSEKRKKYVQKMLQGLSVAEATKELEKWSVRFVKTKKLLYKVYGVTLGPIVNVAFGIVNKLIIKPIKLVYKFIHDAYVMWDTFNKQGCPLWVKPEQIKFNVSKK